MCPPTAHEHAGQRRTPADSANHTRLDRGPCGRPAYAHIIEVDAPRSATPGNWNPRQIGGYRVSHDRGAVTVGNGAPVWPSPTPRTAATTSSVTSRSDQHDHAVSWAGSVAGRAPPRHGNARQQHPVMRPLPGPGHSTHRQARHHRQRGGEHGSQACPHHHKPLSAHAAHPLRQASSLPHSPQADQSEQRHS
jgi:hypothetical protein